MEGTEPAWGLGALLAPGDTKWRHPPHPTPLPLTRFLVPRAGTKGAACPHLNRNNTPQFAHCKGLPCNHPVPSIIPPNSLSGYNPLLHSSQALLYCRPQYFCPDNIAKAFSYHPHYLKPSPGTPSPRALVLLSKHPQPPDSQASQ